jgi:hypothetical protein
MDIAKIQREIDDIGIRIINNKAENHEFILYFRDLMTIGGEIETEIIEHFLSPDTEMDCFIVQHLHQLASIGSKTAKECLRRLADEREDSNARIEYALFLEENFKDLNSSTRYFQLSAWQGNKHAQHICGCRFRDGTGVDKNIETSAFYFEQAALQGDELSLLDLFEILQNKPTNYITKFVTVNFFLLELVFNSKIKMEEYNRVLNTCDENSIFIVVKQIKSILDDRATKEDNNRINFFKYLALECKKVPVVEIIEKFFFGLYFNDNKKIDIRNFILKLLRKRAETSEFFNRFIIYKLIKYLVFGLLLGVVVLTLVTTIGIMGINSICQATQMQPTLIVGVLSVAAAAAIFLIIYFFISKKRYSKIIKEI